MKSKKKIYEKAVEHWGIEAQVKVATEECAELIVALCKINRTVNGSSIVDVLEEIADVEIMLEQLKVIYDHDNLVPELKKKKLKRVKDRLAMEEPRRVDDGGEEVCPNCNGLVKIRNPTGRCDHLYYPDNLSKKARRLVYEKRRDAL